jgi:NAD(P)-dependent dehydrogenase (short-subunit alcohol dehydrogenase family)
VSSTVTLKALPLLAAYTASKAALNAFTECLALELRPFNVRVNLVLPGQGPGTAFGTNAFAQMQKHGVTIPAPYAEMTQQIMSGFRGHKGPVTTSREVSEAIWRVANESSSPMRTPAGADAVALAKSLQ